MVHLVTALIVQTAFLLSFVYLIGCVFGFFARTFYINREKQKVSAVNVTSPSIAEMCLPGDPKTKPLAAEFIRDELQRIDGIREEFEWLLNVHGVTRYSEIASWTLKDTAKFDRLLGLHESHSSQRWVREAQSLIGTATSTARTLSTTTSGEVPRGDSARVSA